MLLRRLFVFPQVEAWVHIYEPRHTESFGTSWWYRTTTKGTGTFVVVCPYDQGGRYERKPL